MLKISGTRLRMLFLIIAMTLNVIPLPAAEQAAVPSQFKPQKDWEVKTIGKGVTLMHKNGLFFVNQLLNVNVIKIQYGANPYRFQLGALPNTKMKTSEFCRKYGAMAGINGGFFRMDNGKALSFLKVGGVTFQTYGKKAENRTTLEDGAVIIGKTGRLMIEPSRGDKEYAQDSSAHEVLVSGPLLIHGDKLRPLTDNGRQPRTALGITSIGEILMVTIDGRSLTSAGATFKELQLLMDSLDCDFAINLDGGGSTTMWVHIDGGKVCNTPCDYEVPDSNGERAVTNCLMLIKNNDK